MECVRKWLVVGRVLQQIVLPVVILKNDFQFSVSSEITPHRKSLRGKLIIQEGGMEGKTGKGSKKEREERREGESGGMDIGTEVQRVEAEAGKEGV